MQQFASKVTRLVLTDTQTLESGQPVRVLGFVFSGGGAGGSLTITTAETSPTTLFEITTFDTYVHNVPFYADKGLKFSAAAPGSTQVVTVLHTHPGS